MNGRVSQYIITSLLAAALVLPVFFWGAADTPLIIDLKTVTGMLLQGLPFLALILGITLYGSADRRRSRGFNRPVMMDLPTIAILLGITLVIGKLFPAESGTYLVRLTGFTGMCAIIVLSLITALTEELFFRSWLLSTLPALGWPRWLALSVSVAAFAVLHLWQSWNGILFSALSAFAYSVFFLKRRSLFPIVAAHTIHNAMALWFAAGR